MNHTNHEETEENIPLIYPTPFEEDDDDVIVVED